MRPFSVLLVMFGLGLAPAAAVGQTCVGLQCQQQTCPGNTSTSISGVVYAPNGTDPLPNVTVYIPNAPVAQFTAGVSCPVVGAPPSGSPLVGTESNVDGTFTIDDVPVGVNIPLVIVSGRWRRQMVIPATTACQNTALPASLVVMPQNRNQGDIPKIAIATGSVDQVECVLRKVGINDSEFTDPTGAGRINLYTGSHGPGAEIDSNTQSENVLMGTSSVLNSYDVLMLPCEAGQYSQPAQQLANLITFANSGGRVYSSHYSYDWMYQNPPFNSVANWNVGQAEPDGGNSGIATVDTSFAAGQTLQTWLQNVGATTTPGQMTLDTLRQDTNGVIAPTQSWLALNDPSAGNPVMQFVFDTPINAPVGQQCGRVLFNEYHVENLITSNPSMSFPTECASLNGLVAGMSPQEKLLEYMLFELTDEGGQPTLNPTTQDFGSEAIGFTSPPQTFTWTNNSSFAYQISGATVTGDFNIVSNGCQGPVAGGASCLIVVTFTPTALGARTGTLTVSSSSNQLTAQLTGTGTPGFTMTPTTFSYGSLDVGNSAAQTFTLTSTASGPLAVPPFVTTGQYSVNTSVCGASVAGGAHCTVTVSFLPTSTGPQNGTLGVSSTSLLYSGLSGTMTGNGIDFTILLTPSSGHVVAGDGTSTTATLTPLAGFAAPVSVSCVVATAATASSCNLTMTAPEVPPQALTVSLSTTSQYTVIGYSGFGGRGVLWLMAVGSGWLLWRRRKSANMLLRSGLAVALLAAIGLAMTGCSGKLPTQNPAYTGPGTYTVTVKATDGFLVHSATYTLTVTAN
jgi:hypothetical protein